MTVQSEFASSLAGNSRVQLRILATSDLHMHLLPFDYGRNRPSVSVGLARTAGLIAAARREARNVLLFDNGDFLQGNALAEISAAEGGHNPMIAAMNALRFDAATLGNHEFDYGLPVLLGALQDAAFPVVSANAVLRRDRDPCSDHTLLAPWTILERRMTDLGGRSAILKVGVIGLVPPQVAVWDRDRVAGRVWFRDMVETAAARVPELRKAGADIVVALAHTGIDAATAAEGMENAAIPLARIAGIDVLVTGHQHLVFPSPRFAGLPGVDVATGQIEGKPAVMPGAFGSHLGVVDLLLAPTRGGWRVDASHVAARPIARTRSGGRLVAAARLSPDVLSAAEPAHGRARLWAKRPLGRSGSRLCTHFALVSDTALFRLVAEAKASALRDHLRGTEWEGFPVLGSATPFRTGGRAGPCGFVDIPAGPVSAGQVADLYPFPNTLCGLRLTGADVKGWLETAVAIYNRIDAGQTDVALLAPDVPGYNLDLLQGLDFTIAADRPVGDRIRQLSHAGRAVVDEDVFVVATSSYRAACSAPRAPVLLAGAKAVPALIEDLIARGGAEAAARVGGWRLCLPPGATVIFDTAPRARIAELAGSGLAAEDLGLTDGGFRRLRLSAAAR